MTAIDRMGGAPAVGAIDFSASVDPRQVVAKTLGTIGDRVLAWTAQSFPLGDAPAAAWSAHTGSSGGFVPDPAVLARGGDVYGVLELAEQVADPFTTTPQEERELERAIWDFTSELALRLNALAGAPAETQIGAATDAFDRALSEESASGVVGVTQRIELAARTLEAVNR